MTNARKSLIENNYLIIPNFIDQDRAKKLAYEFKTYCEEKNLSGDDQAPSSRAEYNYKPFLEILCEKVSEINSGFEEPVLPTYVYSRVYLNGSCLEPHTDRKACEISISVHLDGDQIWPFWIETPQGEKRCVNLYPGDAVVYLGCDALHWREEYRGQWYAQMFLHYVRSNGPNFDNYFDKNNEILKKFDSSKENLDQNKNDSQISIQKDKVENNKLLEEKEKIEERIKEIKSLDFMYKLKKTAIEQEKELERIARRKAEEEVLLMKNKSADEPKILEKNEEKIEKETPLLIVPENNPQTKLEDFILILNDAIPDYICDEILCEYENASEWYDALTEGQILSKNTRNCSQIDISQPEVISKNYEKRFGIDKKIFDYTSECIKNYTKKYKHCFITQDSGYSLLRYNTGQFYTEHTDSFIDRPRSVSCSIALNDDYDGGEFAFFGRNYMAKLMKGSAIMFPSNFMYPHEILPVTKGTRYSIITWFI